MQSTTMNSVFLECYLAHNLVDDLFLELSSGVTLMCISHAWWMVPMIGSLKGTIILVS